MRLFDYRLALLSCAAILMLLYLLSYLDLLLLGAFVAFVGERLLLHSELKKRGFKYE